MMNTLDPGSSSPGLSTGRSYLVVFLGNTLTLIITLIVPLSNQECKWEPDKNAGGLPAMD